MPFVNMRRKRMTLSRATPSDVCEMPDFRRPFADSIEAIFWEPEVSWLLTTLKT